MKKISRILVIDDNPAIHDDFRKIFCPTDKAHETLDLAETALFDAPVSDKKPNEFAVDFADQGEEGLLKIKGALHDGNPYAVAFVDMRMPPGWDGARTTREIRQVVSEIQIAICSAYSDHSWQEMFEIVGHSDQLHVLKKPFDPRDALQLANKLTERWKATHFQGKGDSSSNREA